MMMSLSFKAIETRYKGYRFRSRLEARYAIFFDTLGITYDYEKEGYDLNGTRYLPDFWLPEQQCWVEIKGQEPTEEELRKAKLLALCTGHPVYIIVGIEVDEDIPSPIIHIYYPPSLSLMRHDPQSQQTKYETRDIPLHVLSLLQDLEEAHIEVEVEQPTFEEDIPFTDTTARPCLVFNQSLSCRGSGSIPKLLEQFATQLSILERIAPSIKQYEEDLIAALTVPLGWQTIFHAQIHIDGQEWVECTACGEVRITGMSGRLHRDCSELPLGRWSVNSPYLQEAYTAARSARFEYGEKGGRA